MERNIGESYISYLKRVVEMKTNKSISYREMGEALVDNNRWSAENWRKFYYCIKPILDKIDDDIEYDKIDELTLLKEEIAKERKKIQTVNLEYNANIRAEARTELFNEMVIEAIDRLKPLKEIKLSKLSQTTNRHGLLVISDEHYGKEFRLHGLNGEVVNEYSPQVFKQRMWDIINQMKHDYIKYDKLTIFDLGDNIEGILRMSGLQKLKVGVIDSAIEYAEFLANWLVELASVLNCQIEYNLTGGNHDLLRLLTNKKDFDEENIAKLIHKFISLRLKDEENIKIAPYTDVIYKDFYGIKVMGYHGESKNLKQDIEFFENYYNVDIDVIITGHLHRNSQETIGFASKGDREIIRVPSIVGVDGYSKSIRKSSRAGAKFFVFSDYGKELEKTYFLN